MWGRTLVRGAAFMVAMQLCGCSYLFVQAPPPNHRQLPTFDCTTGTGWPIVDGLFTGLQLVRLATDLSLPSSARIANLWSRNTDLAIGTGMLVLFASSAVVGIQRVDECRRAKAELVQRLSNPPTPDQWATPQPGSPGAPPPPPVPPGARP